MWKRSKWKGNGSLYNCGILQARRGKRDKKVFIGNPLKCLCNWAKDNLSRFTIVGYGSSGELSETKTFIGKTLKNVWATEAQSIQIWRFHRIRFFSFYWLKVSFVFCPCKIENPQNCTFKFFNCTFKFAKNQKLKKHQKIKTKNWQLFVKIIHKYP